MMPTIDPKQLQELAYQDRSAALIELCRQAHPENVAAALMELPISDIHALFVQLPTDLQAEILGYLEQEVQTELVEQLSRQTLAKIFVKMAADERVDLLKVLPPERQDTVLFDLAQSERENIRQLAAYPEGTAGSVMTSDYVALSPELTANEAIAKIRREAPDKETIYYCYVINDERQLIGFISLKDLILARPQRKVGELMKQEVIFAYGNDKREEAARKVAQYDLIALPVVNEHRELVGIITHDDVLDIINAEQTEDMEKFMAIGGGHSGTYLNTPATQHFRNRVYWLITLGILGFLSGMIVQKHEDLIATLPTLMVYLPMIIDMGGNTGSQSATMVIRSLALGEMTSKDIFKVLCKELKVSFLLAVVLAVLVLSKLLFLSGHALLPEGITLYRVASVLVLAMMIQVISSTLLGALLPILAYKLRFDPAVIASPALTTIVDITGVLIFFTLGTILLSV